MQMSKEEYAIERIHNGSSLQIENEVTQVTVRHHSASLVMPNSNPGDGIFNQHLTRSGLRNVLHRGCKMTHVHDVRRTI